MRSRCVKSTRSFTNSYLCFFLLSCSMHHKQFSYCPRRALNQRHTPRLPCSYRKTLSFLNKTDGHIKPTCTEANITRGRTTATIAHLLIGGTRTLETSSVLFTMVYRVHIKYLMTLELLRETICVVQQTYIFIPYGGP